VNKSLQYGERCKNTVKARHGGIYLSPAIQEAELGELQVKANLGNTGKIARHTLKIGKYMTDKQKKC
jgi:hypothetical protein